MFYEDKDNVLIEYSDDGIGLTSTDSGDHFGMGLGNIVNRVRAMGGEYNYKLVPSKGFHAIISIPIIVYKG